MKDDAVYLKHILECIHRIEEDVAAGREHFMAHHTPQDAVLRNLQVLAESTQRLSEALKDSQPTVEWQKISAFRNILVHDYLGIDLEAIWRITQVEIPSLKLAIESMLARLSPWEREPG
ncbi:MAG TPA: HepT-like ribonuclease domain-containing protein [Thermoanaerobaculia bacterium]|nr:HepT-like ribonuclease domain-containing protein [Thermoanaerobaculia bacterium]